MSIRTTIRPAVRLQIAASQSYQCNSCGSILGATFHIDHIEALCLGGSNEISNLCALCPNCHATKTGNDMKLYWDSRNNSRQETRAKLEKLCSDNRCIEGDIESLRETLGENKREIERLSGGLAIAESATVVTAVKLNSEKTLLKFKSRIAEMPRENFIEFAGAFLTDYRVRGISDGSDTRDAHAALLLEEIQRKGFLPAGFVSANKKSGRYVEPLPGGLLRPDEEGFGPRARLVYIGGQNHFTGQEKSRWAIQKIDLVYD